uniref:Kunitz/Bovine pancreatic trypsin inhibitor domain protein n=1 Tax=Strongyloides venezuelensis TaxID=75913 RepID=A0A0K0FWV4_STRVS
LLDDNGKAVLCSIEDDLNSIKTHQSCGGSKMHSCAFRNVNSDIGLCCTNINYENHRCPNGMRPYIPFSMAEETNENSLKPYRCSPLIENYCSTIKNNTKDGVNHQPVCIFDEIYGNYHCCEPFDTVPQIVTEIPHTTKKGYSFNNWSKKDIFEKIHKIGIPITDKNIISKSDNETLGILTTSEDIKSTTIKNEFEESEENGCKIMERPFLDILKKNEILLCNPEVINTCPPGFKCYKSTTKKRHQCCGVSSTCPENSGSLISPVTNSPVTCNKKSGCPLNYFCYQQNEKSLDNGICCSEDPIISLCDHGMGLKNRDGKGIMCKDGSCPKGYHCQERFNISICCPMPEHTCTLLPSKGIPCEIAPPNQQYYFNFETKSCKKFTFTGCSGNDNRFDSKKLCINQCSTASICPLGFPLIDLSSEIKKCSDVNPCLSGYNCIKTLEGDYCCPREDMTCSLPVDHGENCDGSRDYENIENEPILMWYYNIVEMSCLPFEYRGCGGNFNRFISQEHCINSCFVNLCPGGLPQLENGQLLRCNDDIKCGSNYLCINSNFGNVSENSVCCPRPE